MFLVGTDVLADRALHRHLRRQYSVHCVARAADVESLMLDHMPDVLVCEQQLADARGVDLLQKMRVKNRTRCACWRCKARAAKR